MFCKNICHYCHQRRQLPNKQPFTRCRYVCGIATQYTLATSIAHFANKEKTATLRLPRATRTFAHGLWANAKLASKLFIIQEIINTLQLFLF